MQTATRRQYDHRIRRAVVATRNVRLFPDLEIPVSTARTWITRGSRRVVTAANDRPDDIVTLRAEIAALRSKAEMYLAITSVLLVVIRMFGLSLDARRIPDGLDKAKLLRVVRIASRHVSLHGLLKLIGLSPSRYHAWKRLIRNRGWRRPRLRVYPAKAKTGIRATKPNEWWHIDLTVIRLTSGAKVYLHAVIDNFSRKILAWEIADRVAGKTPMPPSATSACPSPPSLAGRLAREIPLSIFPFFPVSPIVSSPRNPGRFKVLWSHRWGRGGTGRETSRGPWKAYRDQQVEVMWRVRR